VVPPASSKFAPTYVRTYVLTPQIMNVNSCTVPRGIPPTNPEAHLRRATDGGKPAPDDFTKSRGAVMFQFRAPGAGPPAVVPSRLPVCRVISLSGTGN